MKLTKKQLTAEIVSLAATVGRLSETVMRLESRTEDQAAQLAGFKHALGGTIWRTMQGHTRFIALLSSDHLRNIIEWTSDERIKVNCRSELRRREIDEEYRKGLRSTKTCQLVLKDTRCRAVVKKPAKRKRTTKRRSTKRRSTKR